MINVRVPATSANMGPAFDCMGIALSLYNFIELEEAESGLFIQQAGSFARHVPTDDKNLVYRSMTRVFDETGYPKGLRLKITANIPSTRGLGSSAACIVGGMVAANAIKGQLGMKDILRLACKEEGHPDNVAPCLMGGVVVSVWDGVDISYVKSKLDNNLKVAIFNPVNVLPTKKSRDSLPETIPHTDAAFNAGRSALLAASIMAGRLENLKVAMQDRLHQQYRSEMVPGMNDIFEQCYKNGAYGCYLSGAGPALAAIVKGDNLLFEARMIEFLNASNYGYTLSIISPDNRGVYITKK